MKKPIHLETDHICSILSALMAEHGLTEFTMTFEDYKRLGLASKGLSFSAEYSDKEYPDSITVTAVDV